MYKVSFIRTSGRASIISRTECYLTSQCTVRQSAHSNHYGDSTHCTSSYEDAVADHTAAADHSSLALGSAVLTCIGREMQ